MKTLYLLPNAYKRIGWLMFVPSFIFGILMLIFHWEFPLVNIPVIYNDALLGKSGFFVEASVDWLGNLIGILVIVGGLLVGFSKEKTEDEYIASLRLKALFWAMGVSYLLVLGLYFAVFGLAFLYIIILAMYLPLVLYVFRFNYCLLTLNNEK